MNPLDNKTEDELVRSLLAEIAKGKNELLCAQGDIDKVNRRLSFALVLLNTIIERQARD